MGGLLISIPNDGDADKILANVFGLLQDPTPILDEASAVLLARMRRNFLQQVAPDGTHWDPSYAAFQRSFGIGRGGQKVKPGGGTLFETGRLFNSIQLYSIGPYERAIGTDVEYAGFLNYGTKNMVARTFLGFSEEDARIAQQVGIKLFTEALQK